MTHSSDGHLSDQRSDSAQPGVAILTTEELFGGKDEIILLHNGAPYRLRITRQNKLILTK